MPRRLKPVLIAVAALLAVLGLGWLAQWYWYPEVVPLPAAGAGIAAGDDVHAARGRGSDSARVDSQVTLRIPAGQADAVYQYLRGKYVGRRDVLADRFPDLHLSGQEMSDTSVFTDEYFDTPRLDLYRNRNSARHRVRVNTTDPDDRKSGRELVQMKVTPPGRFDLRNELKYDVKPSRKLKTAEDLHPLLRLIDKDQRDDFKQVYLDAGIDPMGLRRVFTIQQTRRRGYVNLGTTNVFSFSVDEGRAGVLWAEGSFASVDLGLVEIAYTEADPARREQLWAIRDAIIDDLRRQFPALEVNDNSKYGIVLGQLLQQIPMLGALYRLGAV